MASPAPPRPDLSVVLPVFNNAATLRQICEELRAVLGSMDISYELLFVDDASMDESASILDQLARQHQEVLVLRMRSNFGQQVAVLNALAQAKGACCAIMDADLQDPPAALPQLWAARSRAFSAIFAGRRGRYQSAGRHLTSRIYKHIQRLLTGLPPDVGMFMLLERPVVEALRDFPTRRPTIPMMVGGLGVPTLSIPVERHRRMRGRSSYQGFARLRAAFNGLLCLLEYRYWPPNAPYLQRHPGQAIARPAGRETDFAHKESA